MSDEAQTTTQTPDAGAGQAAATTPNAGAQPPAAQPYRAFATEAELTAFVQRSKSQAERAALRKLASEMGFEDADELRDAIAPLRRGQGQQATTPDATQPATQPGQDEAQRLRTALQVGAELNLPAALVARLQGANVEEMKADAQTLLALMGGQQSRGPGIPSAPSQIKPAPLTPAQLNDPAWVRDNEKLVIEAYRTGNIVRS